MIELNKIYNEEALEFMRKMPDSFLDLTLTSPPYDGLRNYEGFEFSYRDIIAELFRLTKKGGIVVWVVNDQVIKGSESGTSFRQALAFIEAGWRLYDTMIYSKRNPTPNANRRYQQSFEYMFVFSKGRPKTCNIQLRRSKTYLSGKARMKYFQRSIDGNLSKKYHQPKAFVPKSNIWEYTVGGGHVTKDKVAYLHPAIFPEKLAEDHILSWSNKGDLVYDPFVGSGTTTKMAAINGRNYIGSDVSAFYCEIAEERLKMSA